MSVNTRAFTLTSDAGLVVRLTNYGGIIMSILAPDRRGHRANVVLGHDSIDEYRSNPFYLGAIIGRVCRLGSTGGVGSIPAESRSADATRCKSIWLRTNKKLTLQW